MNPKIGLITVSLDGERTDLAKQFEMNALVSLKQSGLEVLENPSLCLNGEEVLRAVENAKNKRADCIVFLIGTWVYAPDIISPIQQFPLPVVVWGIPEPASFSSVGANVIHGTLDELGIKHLLVYGMPCDKETVDSIKGYARASMVKNILYTSKFGLVGGRSLGMYPSTVDSIQVKRIFGVEIEHIDQLLLVETARKIENVKAKSVYEEFKKEYGNIDVPDDVMLKSIKVYAALKKIIEDYKLSFLGVKCLEEVINIYVSCCLAISLCNNDGVPTACQSDINAALAMKILNILSNKATIFADVNMVDKKEGVARLVNCGTMATTLAEMKRDVDWGYQYEYMGNARGACPTFCCKPGEVTFCGLSRIKGDYVMQITTGNAFLQPKEIFAQDRDIWPHAFISLDCDPGNFYQAIRSNHVVVGYGNMKKELQFLCDLMDIKVILNE
jgi:L-fucose isomerase